MWGGSKIEVGKWNREEEERILEEKVLVSACGHNLENKYLS